MKAKPKVYGLIDSQPLLSQDLRLTCSHCGQTEVYDVGTIYLDPDPNTTTPSKYSFANYFRCQHCQSAGPWLVADRFKVLGLAAGVLFKSARARLQPGAMALYDGTRIQTPAMGEEHLLKLIQKQPRDAFLHTRLANLLRNCGQDAKAGECFERALRLDQHDIEARYYLLSAAFEAQQFDTALKQARALVDSLLTGHKTANEELNEQMALSIAGQLRDAPEGFRTLCFTEAGKKPVSKALLFMRTLLELEGDEAEIVGDAADRLLTGVATPDPIHTPADEETPPVDFVPSLLQAVETAELDRVKFTLTVGIETDGHRAIRVSDKHCIPVTDGEKVATWKVAQLTELFRGNRTPPADIDHYPPPYHQYFYMVERHFINLCEVMGDRTDQEMEEIYATLRRRPDGRSLGPVHDSLWQATALLLGSHPLSAAEYEALLGQLTRSVRGWAVSPVSRNYAGFLRKTLAEADE